METLKELSDKELLIAVNNLTRTHNGCLGLKKKERNGKQMNIVLAEMKFRDLHIPSVDERIEKGVFNGEYTS